MSAVIVTLYRADSTPATGGTFDFGVIGTEGVVGVDGIGVANLSVGTYRATFRAGGAWTTFPVTVPAGAGPFNVFDIR